MCIDLIFVLFMFTVAHLLGDYVLQTPYLATMKNISFYHLLSHCLIYTWTFVIMSMVMGNILAPAEIIFIFITHIILDAVKCKRGHNKQTYTMDQILHLVVVMIISLRF